MNTEIWTRPQDANDPNCNKVEMADPNVFKLGLCCINK